MGVPSFLIGLLSGFVLAATALFLLLFRIPLFSSPRSSLRKGTGLTAPGLASALTGAGGALAAKLAASAPTAARASSFAKVPVRSLLDPYYPDAAASAAASAAAASHDYSDDEDHPEGGRGIYDDPAAGPNLSRLLRSPAVVNAGRAPAPAPAQGSSAGAAGPVTEEERALGVSVGEGVLNDDAAWAADVAASSAMLNETVEDYLQKAIEDTNALAQAHEDGDDVDDEERAAVAGDVPGGESVVWLNVLLRRVIQYAITLGLDLDTQASAAAAAAASGALSPTKSPRVTSPRADSNGDASTSKASSSLAASLSSPTAAAAAAADRRSPRSVAASKRRVRYDAETSLFVQLANAAIAAAPLPAPLGPTKVTTLYPGAVAPLLHRVQVLSAAPGEPVVGEVEFTYTGDSVVEVETGIKIDAFGISNLASMPIQVAISNIYLSGCFRFSLALDPTDSALSFCFTSTPTIRFDIASALGYYVQLVNTPHIHALLHKLITTGIEKALVAPKIISVPLLTGLPGKVAKAALDVFGLKPVSVAASKSSEVAPSSGTEKAAGDKQEDSRTNQQQQQQQQQQQRVRPQPSPFAKGAPTPWVAGSGAISSPSGAAAASVGSPTASSPPAAAAAPVQGGGLAPPSLADKASSSQGRARNEDEKDGLGAASPAY